MTSPTVEGYVGNIVMILDLADPAAPQEVGRWWIPGQWQSGGEEYPWDDWVPPRCHHPLRADDRLYVSYWHHGFFILDIADMSKPKLISAANTGPSFPHPTHTCLKMRWKLKGRDIMVVADEDVAKLWPAAPAFTWIYDITQETCPTPIVTFQVDGVDREGAPQEPMTGCHQPSEREVILAGGVINSPQLLMLSGIGHPQELAAQDIAVKAALPGVGKNLQDHVSVTLMYRRKEPGPFHRMMRLDRIARELCKAYLLGKGFAADVPGGITAFLKSRPDVALPDVQFLLTAAPLGAWPYLAPFKQPFDDGFACRIVMIQPASRGSVSLVSADASAHPRIRQNFLSTDGDWGTLRAGVRMAREVAAQTAMAPFVAGEIAPGLDKTADADIDAHIRATSITVHHPAGTCRMGPASDEAAVVDAELRVRGADALRIVDASVMPDLVRGNINAAVVMIGEKAADLILGRTAPRPAQL